ncbi:MAG: PDZ domain-containing protein [Planctomycetota bacterium]|nr:PDZ domain-containing protein [Planctomycetota bacterium]
MTRRQTKAATLAVALFMGIPALALAQDKGAENLKEANLKDRDLMKRVEDLGSDVFEVREGAMEYFREVGKGAIAVLEEAAKSKDPEIRWRGKALLRDIRRGGPLNRDRGQERDRSDDDRDSPFGRRFEWPGPRFRFFDNDRGWQKLFEAPMNVDEMRKRFEKEIDDIQKVFRFRNKGGQLGFNWTLKENDKGFRVRIDPNGGTQIEILKDGDWVSVNRADASEAALYGLKLRPAGDALRAQLSLDEGRGLVVADLDEDGAAAEVGVDKFDLILSVNGQEVGSREEFDKAVGATPKDGKVNLVILRKTKRVELALPLVKTRKF